MHNGAAQRTSLNDEEFIAKASYFILSQELQGKREVDYAKFISSADPKILKDFIKNVTTNFCIKNGRVISILFKNGIELKFFYKAASDEKARKPLDFRAFLVFRFSGNVLYPINIASPKLKKRYFSFTASSYACSTCSRPASAETSMMSVLSGRWKFVTSASIHLKR